MSEFYEIKIEMAEIGATVKGLQHQIDSHFKVFLTTISLIVVLTAAAIGLLYTKVDSVEGKVARAEVRLQAIDGKLSEINGRLDEIKGLVETANVAPAEFGGTGLPYSAIIRLEPD